LDDDNCDAEDFEYERVAEAEYVTQAGIIRLTIKAKKSRSPRVTQPKTRGRSPIDFASLERAGVKMLVLPWLLVSAEKPFNL